MTPFGIVIDLSLLQSENAPTPMLVTVSGISISVRDEHNENADDPMLVTSPSIVTDFRSVQLTKVLSLISVT